MQRVAQLAYAAAAAATAAVISAERASSSVWTVDTGQPFAALKQRVKLASRIVSYRGRAVLDLL